MKQEQLILKTAKVSLGIQVLAGAVGLYGISIPLSPEKIILREILILETIVQFIELVYYVWLVSKFSSIQYDVTSTRYFDWVLSTPIMLITTAVFMLYRNTPKDDGEPPLRLFNVLRENGKTLGKIIGANALMLLFGYLGEKQKVSRFQGFLFGTLFFLMSFGFLYSEFVGSDTLNRVLFWVMLVVWALYGVAYCLDYKTKNVGYNFLDILSKNFYGFFLVYILLGDTSPITP